jgi:oxygen-independent coproporphyrinogen-3 oxidase
LQKSACTASNYGKISDDDLIDIYKSQLDYYHKFSPNYSVETIFFGGGTPSLASEKLLSEVIKYIEKKWVIKSDVEISIEANPSSSTAEKFAAYKSIGINRLSIGIQSLHDDELKFLGRIHDAKTALQTIENGIKFFENISADFIYGLPNHTSEIWLKNLSQIIDIGLPHYSLYQLTIEKNTSFFNSVKCGKISPINDVIEAKLFSQTRKFMRAKKIPAYEVSNFAKYGFECKHNLSYWTGADYIGIGPSAQGRIGHTAFTCDTIDWKKIRTEKLSVVEKSEELILTNLRCKYGLKIDILPKNILDLSAIKEMQKFIKYNEKNQSLKMTEKGFLFFNSVVEKIIS